MASKSGNPDRPFLNVDLSGGMIEVARRAYPYIRFTRKGVGNANYQTDHLDTALRVIKEGRSPLPTSSGQQARPIRRLNQTLTALYTLPAFRFRRYGSTA
jgi:hypothetical protein